MKNISTKSNKVLFIPALFYLSNPLFVAISSRLAGYDTIYLECDHINRKFSTDYQNEIKAMSSVFSELRIIEDVENIITDGHSRIGDIVKYYVSKRNANVEIIKAVKEIKPDVIILTSEDTYVSRFIFHYFPTVPTLVIQQGSLVPSNNEKEALVASLRTKVIYSMLKSLFKYPTLPESPWSSGQKRRRKTPLRAYWSKFWSFNDSGDMKDSRTFYTGNALLDDDIVYGTARIVTANNYRLDRPRLVYATQPLPVTGEVRDKFNDLVLRSLNHERNNRVVIKVHPRDDTKYYEQFFEKLENDEIIVTKDGNLSSLLRETDLFITGWSMTSYQAVAMGVPVIAINPDNIFDYSKRFTNIGIPVASDIDQFTHHYRRFTSAEGLRAFARERTEFLCEINTYSDGKSAARVAGLIRDVVNDTIKY
jgi:hypothetical protein